MVFSPVVIQVRATLAQKKIKQWLAAPESKLDDFMQQYHYQLMSTGPNYNDTNFKLYNKLKERILLASTESSKKSLNHDLTNCISTMINEVKGLMILAAGEPEADEIISTAQKAIADCKQARQEKASIKALEEFFESNDAAMQNMYAFKTILEALQQKDDRFRVPQITQYLAQLNELLEAYQDLNLIACVTGSWTPDEAIIKLNAVISSDKFARFTNALSSLAFNEEMINLYFGPCEQSVKKFIADNLELKKNFLGSLNAYSVISMQHLIRLQMLSSKFAEEFTKLNALKNGDTNLLPAVEAANQSALAIKKVPVEVNARIERRDELKQTCANLAIAKMAGQSAATRKITLLKAILELNLNNGLENKNSKEVMFFDTYLKNLLVCAYPNDFSFDGKAFSINPHGQLSRNQAQYQQMLEALGVKDMKNITFTPDQFNARMLDELFGRDRNPLWLVLKSTLPITERFSASAKIQTYIDIADEFFNKKIGAKQKYLGALNMARAAYAVEPIQPHDVAHIQEAFNPIKLTIKDDKQLARAGKFGNWIVNKHKEHESESYQYIANSVALELTILANIARDKVALPVRAAPTTTTPGALDQQSAPVSATASRKIYVARRGEAFFQETSPKKHDESAHEESEEDIHHKGKDTRGRTQK